MGRHQRGYLYRVNKSWHVRYREDHLLPDGSVKRVQVSRRIAAVVEYPTRSAVWPLVEEMLGPLNTGAQSVQSTLTVAEFIAAQFLPYAQDHLRLSTYDMYESVLRLHISPRTGHVRMREFRTLEAQRLLDGIARDSGMNRASLKKTKAIMSAVFKYARRIGIIHGGNPMTDTVLPNFAPLPADTHAYVLDDVTRMLTILPEPALTAVAIAAFTGFRQGELRGLMWEDYDGARIFVRRTVYQGRILPTKTKKSTAIVPVIGPLRRILDQQRQTSGLIFPSSAFPGKAFSLGKLVESVIRPTLNKCGIRWYGWHAFRRGLATNLHHLGVDDKTIQNILRHASVQTTQNVYIKTVPEDTLQAMQRLEAALEPKAVQ